MPALPKGKRAPTLMRFLALKFAGFNGNAKKSAQKRYLIVKNANISMFVP